METIAGIDPVLLEVDEPEELFDVDTPDDLLLAAAMLDQRRRPAAPAPVIVPTERDAPSAARAAQSEQRQDKCGLVRARASWYPSRRGPVTQLHRGE